MKYTITELENYIDNRFSSIMKEEGLDEHFRRLWTEYMTDVLDVTFFVPEVYLKGFNAIVQDKIRVSPDITERVKKISRRRSANIIAGMSVMFITAAIEAVIKEIIEYWFNNCQNAKEHIQSIKMKEYDLLNIRELHKWVKPTAKSDRDSSKWFQRLERLLKYRADTQLEEIIKEMFRHRTLSSHEKLRTFPMVRGEHMKIWGLGSLVLINDLISHIQKSW
jgi:predicted DNA-binding protein